MFLNDVRTIAMAPSASTVNNICSCYHVGHVEMLRHKIKEEATLLNSRAQLKNTERGIQLVLRRSCKIGM